MSTSIQGVPCPSTARVPRHSLEPLGGEASSSVGRTPFDDSMHLARKRRSPSTYQEARQDAQITMRVLRRKTDKFDRGRKQQRQLFRHSLLAGPGLSDINVAFDAAEQRGREGSARPDRPGDPLRQTRMSRTMGKRQFCASRPWSAHVRALSHDAVIPEDRPRKRVAQAGRPPPGRRSATRE